jgi:hypothetical protein
MKRRAFVTIAALVVALVAGGATATAQTSVTAEVTFAFVAAGKDMPAGKYTFEVPATGPVTVRGPGGSVVMPVITMLGRHDRDRDPELVFDKIGGKFILSEVWIPDKDGVLLYGTKEIHDHAVLGGSNPRK